MCSMQINQNHVARPARPLQQRHVCNSTPASSTMIGGLFQRQRLGQARAGQHRPTAGHQQQHATQLGPPLPQSVPAESDDGRIGVVQLFSETPN